jgi:hypothetical protein
MLVFWPWKVSTPIRNPPDLVISFILPTRWNKNELTKRNSILKQKAKALQLCAIFQNFQQHNGLGLILS